MSTRGVFWAPLGSCSSAGTPATPMEGVFQITAVVVDTPVSAYVSENRPPRTLTDDELDSKKSTLPLVFT